MLLARGEVALLFTLPSKRKPMYYQDSLLDMENVSCVVAMKMNMRLSLLKLLL